MERANARVVRVKESRERERRDMCSSMAARGGGRERGARGGQRDEVEQKVLPEIQMDLREWDSCFWEVLKLDYLPDSMQK